MYLLSNSLKHTRFKESWLEKFFSGKCKDYRYGFFLRFWIQAYIEVIVACLIALYSIQLNIVEQALNLYFSLLLMVKYI